MDPPPHSPPHLAPFHPQPSSPALAYPYMETAPYLQAPPYLQALQALLEHPNTQPAPTMRVPLEVAARKGHAQAVALLLAHPAVKPNRKRQGLILSPPLSPPCPSPPLLHDLLCLAFHTLYMGPFPTPYFR